MPSRILIIWGLGVLGGPREGSGTEATPPAQDIDHRSGTVRLMSLRSLQEMGICPIGGC